jgi:hypothetical protein
MESKATYERRIKAQLTRWKTTINSLTAKIEQAEGGARAKLHEQLDRLHDKGARATKLLENISATSQDAWEEIKSGVEKGWREITQTAKQTAANVRQAIEHPGREEEIRRIAYHLWLDEGCPHGRHLDHWFKAESLWLEQQAAMPPEAPRPVRANPGRKTSTKEPRTKRRAVKTTTGGTKRGADKP